MDPNATLKEIGDCLRSIAGKKESSDMIDEHCRDLFVWIGHGGFEPRWATEPLAESYYRCRAIEEARR